MELDWAEVWSMVRRATLAASPRIKRGLGWRHPRSHDTGTRTSGAIGRRQCRWGVRHPVRGEDTGALGVHSFSEPAGRMAALRAEPSSG